MRTGNCAGQGRERSSSTLAARDRLVRQSILEVIVFSVDSEDAATIFNVDSVPIFVPKVKKIQKLYDATLFCTYVISKQRQEYTAHEGNIQACVISIRRYWFKAYRL
jgi:hypothetical protein